MALSGLAGPAEIGGAWLVWQGLRERSSVLFVGLGAMVLMAYGVLHARQPVQEFGREMAAYGGVFIVGAGVIMYAPRAAV